MADSKKQKDRKFNGHAMSIAGLAAHRQPGIATV
jgi:hypothetical protein